MLDRFGLHPNPLLCTAVDYQAPPPTHLIRRPRNVLTDPPDALIEAVESLNEPGRREGNRPVTVSCDILCRDDSFQASSIAHVTRRRHSHVPSGRTRQARTCSSHRLESAVCVIVDLLKSRLRSFMAPLHDGPALVQQNGHAMDEKDLHNGDVQL
ncbi:hypothetical protein EVAR_9387_1 [Eumeta japonica]|uniref:Uncharacterized protein n=1 Tax=Eumeta variegata TaxID=151549 RepID=A0A4C1UD60_EUMVA|nr:hypothetical protein EVAR_9387_1 [Eumeta japonica]